MNQEPFYDLSIYLGLQGFEVESVELVDDKRHGRIKVIRIERFSGRHECSQCEKRHPRGLFDELRPVRFRDCSIGSPTRPMAVHQRRTTAYGGSSAGTSESSHPQRGCGRTQGGCIRRPGLSSGRGTYIASIVLSSAHQTAGCT